MPLRHRPALRHGACLALLLGAAGCSDADIFQREGSWRPEHVNEANLAATVVDKHDLVQGANDDASPSELSAAAVRRLLTNHVKQLPTTTVGPVGQTTNPGGAGGNAAPGGSGVN